MESICALGGINNRKRGGGRTRRNRLNTRVSVQNRGAGSRRGPSQHGASARLRREGPTRGQWRGGKPQRAATWRPPGRTAPGRTRPSPRPHTGVTQTKDHIAVVSPVPEEERWDLCSLTVFLGQEKNSKRGHRLTHSQASSAIACSLTGPQSEGKGLKQEVKVLMKGNALPHHC